MVCSQTYIRRVFIISLMIVLLLIHSCKLQMRTSASRFDMERNSQQSQQKDGAEPEATRGEAPPTGARGMNTSTNRSSVSIIPTSGATLIPNEAKHNFNRLWELDG